MTMNIRPSRPNMVDRDAQDDVLCCAGHEKMGGHYRTANHFIFFFKELISGRARSAWVGYIFSN
jgi:hypothetical protein